jgi:hypothetical protein
MRFSDLAPTWLLVDVNWLCIQESAPLFDRLRCIVPLGYRPKWFAGLAGFGEPRLRLVEVQPAEQGADQVPRRVKVGRTVERRASRPRESRRAAG